MALALAPSAPAAPGTPGVPGAPTVVFQESFENVANPAVGERLDDYTGPPPTSMTYTAAASWLNEAVCNGIIASYNSLTGSSGCAAGTYNTFIRPLGKAIGVVIGGGDDNQVMADVTAGGASAPTPAATLQTENPITLTSTNRFITFSIDAAATACTASADPLLRFFLMDGSTAIPVTTNAIDVCSDPRGTTVSGAAYPAGPVRVGSYATDGSLFFTGNSLGIKLTNDQTGSSGNDYAVDNLRVLDATPQLDKEFESPTPRGVPTTLTFTITNTSDLAAKKGWSFTDTLPAGLTVADPAGTTTNCTNGSVTAAAGGDTIEVSGDLETNRASCTARVEVVAEEPGDYENCAANVSDIVGLDPPGCDTLSVLPVADLQITKLVEPGPYVAGELVNYTLTVLNDGPNDAEDVTVVDDLPAGLTFISATPEQGTCSASDPIDCDLGAIANGDSVEIDVVAELAPGAEGDPVVNTATVDSAIFDSDETNNSATASIEAEPEDGSLSYFSKRGFDPETGSTAASGGPTGTTGAGNVIDWVVSYRNQTAATANVNITDPIIGNHRFVPGSLETPPFLAPQWSTDGGATYVGTEPALGADGVGATGRSIPGSTGAEIAATPPPPSAVPAPGGGDGFEPLFVGDNVYNVYHHRGGMSGATPITVFDCHVKVTGTRCPGYPTYVSPNAGDAFGTGPSTLTTALYTQAAVSGNKIYYPVGVIGTRDDGVVCANVVTQTSCGFFKLGSYSGGGTNPNNSSATINGGAVIGTNYYTVSHDGEIYCFDVSTETACTGFAPTVANPTTPALIRHPYYNLQAWDDRYLFGTFARASGARDLICVDTTTNASCPGFPKVAYGASVGASNLHNATLAPILNASGDVTGICGVAGANTSEHPFKCFDLSGNPVATPFSETQTSGTGVNWVNFGSIGVVGSRLYFAESTPAGRATYTCWDYSVTPSAPGKIGNVCPGFVPATTNADVRAYAIRQDPQNPECMWQLGDRNRFEVFSATFGGTGCRFGNAVVRLEPEDHYCDGTEGHVSGWEAIRLLGLTSADYDGVAVTITDANGDPVPGWQNRIISNASQVIDISSIPYAGDTRTLNVAVAISWGSKPVKPVTVRTTFEGDPPQICFQTQVRAADCTDAQQITNDANAITNGGPGNSDAPAGNDSGPVTFDLPADPGACRTDLELTKTADAVDGAVPPGDPVTWTLTVTNNGPDASTGSTVTDTLPAGVSGLATTTPGCTIEGSLLTCEVGALDPDESAEIVVTGDAPQASSTCFENAASVEADEPDPDEENNDASTRTCTNAAADLEIEKSAAPSLVSPGGGVTWTLTVTNNGPDPSTGSTVTDTLPDSVSGVASTTPGCTVDGNTVTCEVGALNPGASTDIVVTGDAPDAPATCFENAASVDGNEGDPVAENDEDSVRACTTPDADLALEKTAAEFVDPGGEVTWTLTVTNDGTADSSGSTVTDTLPAGITGAATDTPGCTIEANELTCAVGPLDAGASTDIVVTGTAPDVPSTCFTNDASVEGGATESDPDLSNNDASARTCTREADLELTKTIDDDLVSPGTGVTWTITVTNNGPDQSPGGTVTDTLPDGVTNVATSDPRCEVTGNEVSCDIGPLPDGESTDIVMTGDAPAASSTCFENAASVASESDLVEENDGDSVRACTTPIADLELEKSASTEVDPGGEVTWTIRATNRGPDPSTGLTVTDTLPDGITGITAPGCTVDGRTVTCTSEEDLAVDEFVEFTITGNAPNAGSTCFENAASVEGERGDPDLSDNEASAETCTNEGAELQIDKVASEGPRFAGDDVTYTLAVRNNGPATAHDVTVTDDLPDGLTFVSAAPNADCVQSDPVSCDLGTLAPGGTAEITIVATIGADQAGNGIDNTACVAAEEPDSFEANDCDTEHINVNSEADLAITKTVDPGEPVQLGETVTYTLLVQNLGPNDDNLVTVTDDFIEGSAEVLEVTPSQGSCSGEDPITCELGAILAGGDVTITVVARPLRKGTLLNQATVTPSITDRNPDNNEDDATIRVLAPSLDLKKRASKARARAGEVLSFKLTLRNRGDGVATDIRVCDRVPAGLKVLRAPGADKRTKRRVCWLVESLAAGAKRTLRITVQVKDNVKPGKRLRNVAVAEGPNGDEAKAGDTIGIAPTGDDCPRFARC